MNSKNLSWIGLFGFMIVACGSNDDDNTNSVSIDKPEMVVIPAGSFQMGNKNSPNGTVADSYFSSQVPVHGVTIATFEIGKFEVTFEEYDRYLQSKGVNTSNITETSDEGYDNEWGRGNRPVINVSWDDIQDYLDWLNTKQGIALDALTRYRLPTEAEWEYAARAGTKTGYSTGSCIDTSQANYNGDFSWNYMIPVGTIELTVTCPKTDLNRERTESTGSFAANPFGLYEMHGNVWEWTEDCWHDSYEDAPDNGSAWLSERGGNCLNRVIRGGSWFHNQWDLLSASRNGFPTDYRQFNGGFRLARSLNTTSAPVAKAGSNQSIKLGAMINLDASNSFDPEGNELTYTWRFIATPNGNTDSLSNTTAELSSFTPSAVGEYKVELVVNDGQVDSAPDTVTVTVAAADAVSVPPIADASQNRAVISGDSVTLNGDNSSDSDGSIVSYSWVSEDDSVSLSSTNTVTTTFIAPTVSASKTYSFELTVTDNNGTPASDTVVITIIPPNEAPTAKAKADRTTVTVGETITMDATGSTGPNQDSLKYQWSVTTNPEGSTALLSSVSSATPTFVPDVMGSYTIELTVSDELLSDATTLTLTAIAVLTVAKPEMVLIPGGSFLMGDETSPDGTTRGSGRDNEVPVHGVTIATFEMGKYEVTFDEYDLYLKSKGVDTSNITSSSDEGYDNGWGRGNRPVTGVSWGDVQGYLIWLNTEQNIAFNDPKRYRLPTESEWEYAARAGTSTKYPWGNTINHDDANFGGNSCCDGLAVVDTRDIYLNTAPVGQFAVSPLGLYDMHGNIWEWVEDCWHDSYIGAPSDGSAWVTSCTDSRRMLRGGYWGIGSWRMRSAFRMSFPTDSRFMRPLWGFNGFRLARTL